MALTEKKDAPTRTPLHYGVRRGRAYWGRVNRITDTNSSTYTTESAVVVPAILAPNGTQAYETGAYHFRGLKPRTLPRTRLRWAVSDVVIVNNVEKH